MSTSPSTVRVGVHIVMVRKLCSLATAATALVALAAAPGGAAVAQAQGTPSCNITGTISFKPTLTSTPAAKGYKLMLVATGTGCDNSTVTGGKAPITDVAVKAQMKLMPGSNCNIKVVSTGKVQVKWQGRNSQNNLMTVAVANQKLGSGGTSLFTTAWAGITNTRSGTAFFMKQALVHVDSVDPDPITTCNTSGMSTLAVTGYVEML